MLPLLPAFNAGRLLFAVAFIVLTCQARLSLAQTYNYDNAGSDYSGKISYSDISRHPTDKGSTNWKWGETRSVSVGGYEKSTAFNQLFSKTIGNGDDSADQTVSIGPGYNKVWTVTMAKSGRGCTSPAVWGSCITEDKSWDNSGEVTVTTAALKKPNDLTVTSGREETTISLRWVKGTNVPDQYTEYVILRNNAEVATVAGSLRVYTDTPPSPNVSYSYTVKTRLNASGRALWGSQTSEASNAVQAFIYRNTFTASDGDYGKVVLKWADLSKFADEIIVYRDNEELETLSKSSKSYSDLDGIPGRKYKYSILPVKEGESFTMQSDSGYKKSIGKISGTVRSRQSSGVEGVTVTATATVEGRALVYTTLTDAAGYYELTELYFGGGDGNFTVRPSYSDHGFKPGALTRKLNLNSPTASVVDFTDTAALAITGKVYFAANAEVALKLPVPEAEIYLNGVNSGVKTKSDGSYAITVFDVGTHSLQIKYKKHKIVAANGTAADSIRRISVFSSVPNVDFEDRQTDSLIIKIQAGCNGPVGDSIQVRLGSKNVGQSTAGASIKLQKNYMVYANGKVNNLPDEATNGIKNLVLPATEYEVEILNVFANGMPDDNKLEYFKKTKGLGLVPADLSLRDTVKVITEKTKVNHTDAVVITLPDGRKDTLTREINDTVTVSDTAKVAKARQLDFIYHNDLKLVINDADVFGLKDFAGGTKKYLLSQNDAPSIDIRVMEHYSYKGIDYDCAIDSGIVYVYDAVSDVTDRRQYTVPKGGLIRYKLKIGKPVLEAPYEKSLQIVAVIGGKTVSKTIKAVVEGERPRNSTFLTKTPEIPFFVLHDPPGDLSFSSVSKGTTLSTTTTTQYNVGGGAGLYVDGKVGAGTTVPFVGKIGADVYAAAKIEAGRDNSDSQTSTFSFSFNEAFSTSGDERLVGNDGDVYVGASLNMEYALTDVLTYDETLKGMKRDTSFAADYTGFNTTYMYTEYHIKNTLLPQLNTVYNLSQSKFNAARLQKEAGATAVTETVLAQLHREMLENQSNIEAWNKALAKNDEARKKAVPRQLPNGMPGVVGGNISFSAGAPYDNSLTIDTVSNSSFDFSIYLNTEAKIGLGVHAGDFNSVEAGALMNVRFNTGKLTSNDTVTTKTVSYHLEDNDLGDFFSVNLAEDRTYGTPVFNTVTGSSSCPHEDNTQFRHLPFIAMEGTNEQRNVPADQSAKFEISISNRSESDETVEYAVKLNPLSNPNGARVLVGGQNVVNGSAVFTIPTGKSFKLPVEVFKGPLSSIYEDLALVMFSTCDNTLDDIDENAKSKPQVNLNAYFQSLCSQVDLFRPGNNWLVNQSNDNKLFVAFSKYDASESSPLTSVTLEYRKLNTGFLDNQWASVVTVPKSQLVEKYYNYSFDVSGLDDGDYEIRATAVCAGVDVTYSPVYTGRIDRKSAVTFGLPSPRDGILRIGDYVGVTFNKDISCNDQLNPVRARLIRKDTGEEIPATLICNGKQIEIRTVPESAIDNYENIELTAIVENVKDATGNLVTDSVRWNLVVSRSPLYWDPTSVSVDMTENQEKSFAAKMRSKVATDQTFRLTKYPVWLNPVIKTGKISPMGEMNISFIIDRNLNTGTYRDTVVALIGTKTQYLYVDVNVLRNPPVWQVNPAAYKYNMSITAQFSRNQTDTLTSKDIRDKIGVFAGNECRGTAFVEYDAALQKYVAFITAYSNKPNAESLSFHLWDAYPGVEYESVERLEFTSGGIVGNTADPYIAHPDGVYQTILLKKGWNWISLNVKNSDMSVKNILGSLKSAPGDLIKTLRNNAYNQYSAGMGWVGTIDSISLYAGYMISVAHDDTLRVLGQIQEKTQLVQLNKGWNWMSYPMPVNIDIRTYFKNYSPADKDIVVSQEEFAQYNAGTNTWSGSLKYLRPGKGYKIYSNNGMTVPVFAPNNQDSDGAFIDALTNSSGAAVVANNPQSILSSSIDPTVKLSSVSFENNMSVTAVIVQDGDRVTNAGRYEIRMYVDNELVSIAAPTILPDGKAIAFIPVYGRDNQDGKIAEVKIYDKQLNKLFPITVSLAGKNGPKVSGADIIMSADGITGTLENPKVLSLNGDADVMLSRSLDKQLASPGDTVQLNISIKNNGPDAGLNVKLSDLLQESFDVISPNSAGFSYNSITHELSLNFDKIANNERRDISVLLRPKKVGQYSIGANPVTLDNDKNTANNSAAAVSLSVVDRRADQAKIFIPQLFSPNGDGINDRFEIPGLIDYYSSNELVIYNKSYNEVYHKKNYQNDWTGDQLPKGSYGYILRAITADGNEKVFRGYITIVY